MGLRTVAVIALAIILAIQPLAYTPGIAQKQKPGMTIDQPDPAEHNIQAPLTAAVMVKFYTNVSVYDPDNRPIHVYLNATVGADWDIEVFPVEMEFTSTGEKPLMVSVIVPKNTQESNHIQVYIRATATYPNDSMQAYTVAGMSIVQKYALEMSHALSWRGQFSTRFSFNITNRGTGIDTFRLEVRNYQSIYHSLDTRFDPETSTMKPNQTKMVVFSVDYMGSTFPKTFTIWIRLTSYNAQSHGQTPSTWDVNITVTFKAPDTGKMNMAFIGAIVGMVVVMAVVMAVIMMGSGKKTKKGPDEKD